MIEIKQTITETIREAFEENIKGDNMADTTPLDTRTGNTYIWYMGKVIPVRKLLQILRKDGWYKDGQESSHVQFKHPSKKGKVTVPYHKEGDDMPKGTANNILRQAGLKELD